MPTNNTVFRTFLIGTFRYDFQYPRRILFRLVIEVLFQSSLAALHVKLINPCLVTHYDAFYERRVRIVSFKHALTRGETVSMGQRYPRDESI